MVFFPKFEASLARRVSACRLPPRTSPARARCSTIKGRPLSPVRGGAPAARAVFPAAHPVLLIHPESCVSPLPLNKPPIDQQFPKEVGRLLILTKMIFGSLVETMFVLHFPSSLKPLFKGVFEEGF